MVKRTHLGAMVVAVALAAWGASLGSAQSAPAAGATNPPAEDTAPCSVAPQPEPCGAKTWKPSTAERLPFPGESSDNTSPDAAAPGIGGVPQAPGASPEPAAKKDAAKEFPFPDDVSKPTANGSSSSSSSSSGDDASPMDPGADPDADPALKDKGSEGNTATPGRHLLHRVNPIGTKLQTPDEREAEDLNVAHFYTQSGNLQGAYLRGQDAVKTAPDDPDAHFALAEIAQKLNKRAEAIAEYRACLKLDPSDKEAKDARKALARLKP